MSGTFLRRLIVSQKKRRRAILLLAIFAITIGALGFHFRVYLMTPKHFDSPRELSDHVGFPNSRWRGTHYVGDQGYSSLFLHVTYEHSLLAIPADSWEPPRRFPLTHETKEWIKWHDCQDHFEPPHEKTAPVPGRRLEK